MTKPLLHDPLLDVLCEYLTDRAICMVDGQGKICRWNNGASRFYRCDTTHIIGLSAEVLFDQPPLKAALTLAENNGIYQAEWRLKTNNEVVLVTLQPMSSADMDGNFSLFCQSLFYEKKAGAALAADSVPLHEDNLFRQLIEHSHSGISLFDADLNFLYRSPAAGRITGFTNTARTDASFNDIVHPADQLRVKTLLDELRRSPGSSVTCHMRSRHFDGRFVDLECVFTNWLNEPGIHAIVLNFHDVTEARSAESKLQALMQELSNYQYALDEAAIVAITDRAGKIIHVNNNFCHISGFSSQELIGQDHRIINSGYHSKEYIKNLWHTIAAGKIWRGELRNKAKNGDHYWVATTIVPFLNASGKPYQYMAIRYDITAAKQAEEDLQRIFESVPDIICTIGADRRFRQVNAAACHLLGYTEAELLQKTVDELIFPPDLAQSRQRMQLFMEGEIDVGSFENRYVKKDGVVINLAWSVRNVTEEGLFFCVAKDITEKKQLEELLHKSNELARIGSWALYPQTGGVYWSPITRELLEVAADYDMEWGLADIFCGPEALNKINSAIASVIDGGDPFDVEIEVRTGKGTMRWVRILGEGEFFEGVCTQVYGTVQDVDTRKRAQDQLLVQAEQLAAFGERYSELFQISPLPKFVFDVDTLAFLDVNKAAEINYGYSREEFLQMTLRDIRPANELERLEQVVRDRGRSEYQFKPGVFTHIKKNGEHIQVEIVTSALHYLERPARLALALDVTERNRHIAEIESQNRKLREISWMQSHIIRAPLSRIMGLVALLRDTKPDINDIAEIIEYIRVSADELDQVIRNIIDNAKINNAP